MGKPIAVPALLLIVAAMLAACETTDYHGPHETYDGGRGGEMHFPAGVSHTNNETAGYGGNPPPLHPAPALVPDIPAQPAAATP